MTPKENKPDENDCNCCQALEEICENTRAIRRVVNRIFDHMHEYNSKVEYDNNSDLDADEFSWDDLNNKDDMYM
jgi:hypothetical protein